jgi:hypothetical protein
MSTFEYEMYNPVVFPGRTGMTGVRLLDYTAIQIFATAIEGHNTYENAAEYAYRAADALLEARLLAYGAVQTKDGSMK